MFLIRHGGPVFSEFCLTLLNWEKLDCSTSSRKTSCPWWSATLSLASSWPSSSSWRSCWPAPTWRKSPGERGEPTGRTPSMIDIERPPRPYVAKQRSKTCSRGPPRFNRHLILKNSFKEYKVGRHTHPYLNLNLYFSQFVPVNKSHFIKLIPSGTSESISKVTGSLISQNSNAWKIFLTKLF